MNFCPGELFLKLLARIGEWHQNLSEKTAGTPPGRYTPPGPGTPPWDQVTSPDQVHPPQPPPPRDQVHPPPGIRYTPTGPGTPNPQWDQVHPPGIRYTPPGPGTPNPQWDQVHLPSPREQCVLGDMGNKRALRILLKCILVF